MKELKSAGLIYDPSSGTQFIDWFINNLKFHIRISSHFSKMEWSLPPRKDLLRNLKDSAKRLKLNAMSRGVSKVVNIHDCLVPRSTG